MTAPHSQPAISWTTALIAREHRREQGESWRCECEACILCRRHYHPTSNIKHLCVDQPGEPAPAPAIQTEASRGAAGSGDRTKMPVAVVPLSDSERSSRKTRKGAQGVKIFALQRYAKILMELRQTSKALAYCERSSEVEEQELRMREREGIQEATNVLIAEREALLRRRRKELVAGSAKASERLLHLLEQESLVSNKLGMGLPPAARAGGFA